MENIDNFNKKRFMIEAGIISAWVMTHEELASDKIMEVSQDGSKK